MKAARSQVSGIDPHANQVCSTGAARLKPRAKSELHRMKLASKRLATLVLGRFARGVVAADMPPGLLIKTRVCEFLSVLRQASGKEALRRFAEQKLMQRLDLREMTRLAMGAAWSKANLRQRRALNGGFRRLLLSTYSGALCSAANRDLRLEVKPVRHSGDNEVTVKTLINQVDKPAVAIDYRMHLRGDSWKVYDVLVDGLSLITEYHARFAAQSQHDGIEGLIKALGASRGFIGTRRDAYTGAPA